MTQENSSLSRSSSPWTVIEGGRSYQNLQFFSVIDDSDDLFESDYRPASSSGTNLIERSRSLSSESRNRNILYSFHAIECNSISSCTNPIHEVCPDELLPLRQTHSFSHQRLNIYSQRTPSCTGYKLRDGTNIQLSRKLSSKRCITPHGTQPIATGQHGWIDIFFQEIYFATKHLRKYFPMFLSHLMLFSFGFIIGKSQAKKCSLKKS